VHESQCHMDICWFLPCFLVAEIVPVIVLAIKISRSVIVGRNEERGGSIRSELGRLWTFVTFTFRWQAYVVVLWTICVSSLIYIRLVFGQAGIAGKLRPLWRCRSKLLIVPLTFSAATSAFKRTLTMPQSLTRLRERSTSCALVPAFVHSNFSLCLDGDSCSWWFSRGIHVRSAMTVTQA